MKNPANLPQDQLVEIVTGVLQFLYGTEQEDGSWTYVADKEWCGSDVCEAVDVLLGRFGLTPWAVTEGEPMEPAKAE